MRGGHGRCRAAEQVAFSGYFRYGWERAGKGERASGITFLLNFLKSSLRPAVDPIPGGGRATIEFRSCDPRNAMTRRGDTTQVTR